MADERDFELLDDYLTDRMSARDRSAFEQRLQSDPDLQQEYVLQKRVIQGIKDARVAQLKSMLNQVPVPSGSSGNAIASKVVIGAVVAIIIAGAALWFLRDEPTRLDQPSTVQQESAGPADKSAPLPEEPAKETSPNQEAQPQESDRNQTSAGTEHSKPSLAKRPDPVSGPTEDAPSSDASDAGTDAVVSVDIAEADGRYPFHYQLNNGRLLLYGPFEKTAYEVVSVQSSTGKIVSLYHQDKYYLLNDKAPDIRALTPVTDPDLLNSLQQQRLSE